MLIYAIIFINLAFVFYTIGVWSEKIQKKLKGWHLGNCFNANPCNLGNGK